MKDLYSYLINLDRKRELPFKIKKYSDNYYDDYNSETSEFVKFTIGVNQYEVGWWNKIEDGEDWAQAESYNGDIFIKNGVNVLSNEIFEDIKNYLSIERDLKLKEILKNND